MLTNREGKSVNKAQLVDAIASVADMSKAQATRALDATIEAITKALKHGDSVSLVGFGTWTVKRRQARMGRNPRTGATLQIPAANVPSFRAGKSLKDSVQ